jgi:hypothetical protein
MTRGPPGNAVRWNIGRHATRAGLGTTRGHGDRSGMGLEASARNHSTTQTDDFPHRPNKPGPLSLHGDTGGQDPPSRPRIPCPRAHSSRPGMASSGPIAPESQSRSRSCSPYLGFRRVDGRVLTIIEEVHRYGRVRATLKLDWLQSAPFPCSRGHTRPPGAVRVRPHVVQNAELVR